MLKTIHAEFDSISSAEAAANRINLSVPGIKSIDIPSYSKPNHIGNQSITANSLIPFSIPTANYSTTLIVSAGNSINETEVSYPTSLSITCDEKSIKLVEQFLISMGGLSIHITKFNNKF
ncbi:MAG: hypothetical protein GX365_06755 [Clostridiales bacterium]|nr:hypothetical protein [Clostridiales bacterium]